MPWSIEKQEDEWCVIKDSDESVEGCHETEGEAKAQLAALNIAEEERGRMNKFERLMKRIGDAVRELFPERAIAMGRIWGQVDTLLYDVEGYPWLKDLYRDDDGSLYGVVAKEGKLFRMSIDVEGEDVSLGEFEQVTEVHQPARMKIRQQENGKFRWFSVSCTAVLNRVGEIDSRDLYDSFIAHAEKTGEFPVRDFYHLGDVFRTGQFDFLARDENLLITSGEYDDSELARREIAARQKNPDQWGDSISFVATEEAELINVGEFDIPVYRAGILHFVSTVAEKDAAAWFTRGTVQQEVDRMLDKRKLGALVELFDGDEEAAQEWLTENAEGLNRSIEENGLITRDVVPTEETPDLSVELDEAFVKEVVRQMEEGDNFALLAQRNAELSDHINVLTDQVVAQTEQLTGFVEQLTGFVERIADLEQDEQKKKEAFLGSLPAPRKVRAGFRPRQERKSEDEEDGAKQPDLSDVVGAY